MRTLIKQVLNDILLEQRKTWTIDKVIDIASKFSSRKEFRKLKPQAYRMAIKYNLFGNGINHLGLTKDRKPANYWTYDKVREEALKYSNRRDFEKGSPNAYRASKQHGWYHDVTSHMDYLGSLYKRAVYAWEFPNNTVYIGLTDDTERRENEHLDPEGRTAVSKFIKETNLVPTLKLISDYIDVKEAQNIERCSIDLYKSTGWVVLNKVKGGGLGACKRIWTKESVEQEALKYNSKSEFKKSNHSAYVIAVREGWIDDATKHMTPKQLTWDERTIRDIASKYTNLTDFLKNEPKAAEAARKRGVYNDITSLMNRSNKDTTKPKYTNEDDIKREISNYSSITDLRNNNPSLYNSIRKYNMTEYLRNYFNLPNQTKWDVNKVKDEASKYNSRFEFQKGNPTAYQKARKLGLLDVLFK
jgi:predicted GIY-YIG superfamily endonuclease